MSAEQKSCDSEESEDNLPSAEVCQARCEEFTKVTGTDEALAQFYLQDVDWNLQLALNSYFEANSDSVASSIHKDHFQSERAETSSVKRAPDDSTTLFTSDNAPSSSSSGQQHDRQEEELSDRYIKLISWNVDGLDTNNILSRTRAVSDIISKEKPDIVFLQEVITESYDYFENKCLDYDIISGNSEGYFTVMMVKKRRVKLKNHSVIPFYSSLMQRNLLVADVVISGLNLHLVTSHLESTRDHSAERIKQLKAAFKHIQCDCSRYDTVIFGGDLNLRDSELHSTGGLPHGIVDLWEHCGARPELKYTWDTLRNDNKQMDSKFKARCRFDRLYFRLDKPILRRLKPVHFGLRGLEKVPNCQRFPSDHWALLAVFEILKV